MDLLDQPLDVAGPSCGRRSAQDLARAFALGLLRREHAGVDGRGDAGNRHPVLERDLCSQATGAFLPGLVEHLIDQEAVALWILDAENPGGDFDEERLERAAVPLAEHLGESFRA